MMSSVTILALYDTPEQGRQAIDQLQRHRVEAERISLVIPRDRVGRASTVSSWLAGTGVVEVPRLGTVLAGGPLVAAGAGLSRVGLAGALLDYHVPEELALAYAEGVRRGGTLVTVRTDEVGRAEAEGVLVDAVPVDIAERRAHWQQEAASTRTDDIPRAGGEGEGEAQGSTPGPIGEAGIGPPAVGAGGAAHDRDAARHTTVTGDVPGPVGFPGPADAMPRPATPYMPPLASSAGNPVRPADAAEPPGDPGLDASSSQPDEEDERTYRQHFQLRLHERGYLYEQTRPAYEYGRRLAYDHRFRDHDWAAIEPHARHMFDERNPGTWTLFAEAVRTGFEHSREKLRRRAG